MKVTAARKWREENYTNWKLKKRLEELMFSSGITEQELCKKLNLPLKSWDHIKRGVRRPSHTLLQEIMNILGDEVQTLFLGYYITDNPPKFLRADHYKNNVLTTKSKDLIKDKKRKKKKFVYLNY